MRQLKKKARAAAGRRPPYPPRVADALLIFLPPLRSRRARSALVSRFVESWVVSFAIAVAIAGARYAKVFPDPVAALHTEVAARERERGTATSLDRRERREPQSKRDRSFQSLRGGGRRVGTTVGDGGQSRRQRVDASRADRERRRGREGVDAGRDRVESTASPFVANLSAALLTQRVHYLDRDVVVRSLDLGAPRAGARDAADASEASASSRASNDPGNRSSSASGRHRPCDRAPPRRSERTPPHSRSAHARRCDAGAPSSPPPRGRAAGAWPCRRVSCAPRCRDRDRRRLGRLGRPGRLARLARRARARPPRGHRERASGRGHRESRAAETRPRRVGVRARATSSEDLT